MRRRDDEITAALHNPTLLERLSALEHERWSHWQRYLHAQCLPGPDGTLIIPVDLVHHWSTQMDTPYSGLTDDEKERDREQVRPLLSAIEALLVRAEDDPLAAPAT